MTPQFKDHNDRERSLSNNSQSQSRNHRILTLGSNFMLRNSTTDMVQGSKSARLLNTSQTSAYSPLGVNLADLTMRASVGESCIQVNRKAVKEARPPANRGDDRQSSSHQDEIVGAAAAEITLYNESECKTNEELTPRISSLKRGSSPNSINMKKTSFKIAAD